MVEEIWDQIVSATPYELIDIDLRLLRVMNFECSSHSHSLESSLQKINNFSKLPN